MNDSARSENIELAHRVITTCGKFEPELVRHDLDEGVAFVLPYTADGDPVVISGREDVIAFILEVADHIPAGEFAEHTYDTLHGDPGVVVARYTLDTKLLSTGLPYRNEYLTLITIVDGKVTRYEELLNPVHWLVARGGEVREPETA